MIIGIPKEIKNNEFRVSATASGVHAYVAAGSKKSKKLPKSAPLFLVVVSNN